MLFLYINLCLNVFGQEPSVGGETVASTQELPEKELPEKELPANIEGLSPQDNTMIQLMLNSDQKISHEQRLLGGNLDSENTIMVEGNHDTKNQMQFVDTSQLYDFIIALVCIALFLLGIVTFISRKKTSNIPQMRMVARSMYGNEGSLAIIALENEASNDTQYILLGLNQGAAPRLIMELDSYTETSSKKRSNQKQLKSSNSNKKPQNFESGSSFDSKKDDLRDVLSRANFSNGQGVPKIDPLHTVVDNDISFDDEEFLLQDQDIVEDKGKPQVSPKKQTSVNTSDEDKWLKELQNAMKGKFSDSD